MLSVKECLTNVSEALSFYDEYKENFEGIMRIPVVATLKAKNVELLNKVDDLNHIIILQENQIKLLTQVIDVGTTHNSSYSVPSEPDQQCHGMPRPKWDMEDRIADFVKKHSPTDAGVTELESTTLCGMIRAPNDEVRDEIEIESVHEDEVKEEVVEKEIEGGGEDEEEVEEEEVEEDEVKEEVVEKEIEGGGEDEVEEEEEIKEKEVEEEEVEEEEVEEEEVEEEEVEEEEEVKEKEVEEDEVEEEEVEEEEVEEEEVEEDKVEYKDGNLKHNVFTKNEIIAEEETVDSDEEEVFEIELDGVTFYTTNVINGEIYEKLENEEVGELMGNFKNGIASYID